MSDFQGIIGDPEHSRTLGAPVTTVYISEMDGHWYSWSHYVGERGNEFKQRIKDEGESSHREALMCAIRIRYQHAGRNVNFIDADNPPLSCPECGQTIAIGVQRPHPRDETRMAVYHQTCWDERIGYIRQELARGKKENLHRIIMAPPDADEHEDLFGKLTDEQKIKWFEQGGV